jgi:hypothetical protein
MHFSSDLFELVFRGNAQFAGKEANLKKTSIKTFDYQSLYFGVQKVSADEKYTLGATAAFIRGGNYQNLKMKNTTMYTEPSGQYIDLNGDISFSRYPYDSSVSALKSHGKGASVNLFFSMKNNDKGRLNFEIRDLGFITWKGIKTYSGNSTFHYNGVLIDDLLSSGTSVADDITVDSIAAATGLKIETKNKTMFLPTVFHLNYMFFPNTKHTRTVGVRYMATSGYIPRIYLKEADVLGKGFTLVNTISYGGFGRFDYEIGMMKVIKDSFVICANLFAFEYLVLPGKSSGHGINIGLSKRF